MIWFSFYFLKLRHFKDKHFVKFSHSIFYNSFKCDNKQVWMKIKSFFRTDSSKLDSLKVFLWRSIADLRWRTASQWWMSVLTISPDSTSHTRTVLSLDPLIITFSSYCKHSTEPVWPKKFKISQYFSCLYFLCLLFTQTKVFLIFYNLKTLHSRNSQ